MYPRHPFYYQCTVCNAVFETGTLVENEAKEGLSPDDLPSFKDPGPDEYFQLKSTAMNDTEAERDNRKYLCILMHQAFNDRTRDGKPDFLREHDETRYRDNALELISLLDENSDNDRMLIAEIYRNIGDFENAIRYIRKVFNRNLKPFATQILKEAEGCNRHVILINREA
jgi:hypothetical protein